MVFKVYVCDVCDGEIDVCDGEIDVYDGKDDLWWWGWCLMVKVDMFYGSPFPLWFLLNRTLLEVELFLPCFMVLRWVFVKLQAKSLDYELTLFYPCHKNKKNNKSNKKNPSPKFIRRGSARRLKFDT